MGTASSAAGAAVYSPFLLFFYDLVVLWFSNTYLWRCPTKTTLLPFFVRNISKIHLDIGVGTGYYLRKATESGCITKDSKITLVDLNPGSLATAKKELKQATGVDAETLLWDIMVPLPVSSSSKPIMYDSISLFYLLHCMPGPCWVKASIFSHLKHNLTPQGVLYGATVLGDGTSLRDGNEVKHNVLGRFVFNLYNRRGIFGNVGDREEVFVEGLRESFEDVKTSVVGVVLLFRAQGPKV
jgi:SAM-dependent methyltransferase